jgi:hypothetical protein
MGEPLMARSVKNLLWTRVVIWISFGWPLVACAWLDWLGLAGLARLGRLARAARLFAAVVAAGRGETGCERGRKKRVEK